MSSASRPVREQAEAFGIGSDDLHIAAAGRRLAAIGDIPDTAALAQTGIGQRDVALTPLQMAMIAADHRQQRRADGAAPGQRRLPEPDLTVLDSTEPESLGQAIRSPVADQLTQMMIESSERRPAAAASSTGVDRVQDRHRGARRRPEEHAAARLVRRVRARPTTRRSRSR